MKYTRKCNKDQLKRKKKKEHRRNVTAEKKEKKTRHTKKKCPSSFVLYKREKKKTVSKKKTCSEIAMRLVVQVLERIDWFLRRCGRHGISLKSCLWRIFP